MEIGPGNYLRFLACGATTLILAGCGSGSDSANNNLVSVPGSSEPNLLQKISTLSQAT
jgi:hypothetical protein